MIVGRPQLWSERRCKSIATLTPAGTGTPITAFTVPDLDAALERLQVANVVVTVAPAEQRMRVSTTVFNTHDDIDRLVAALS